MRAIRAVMRVAIRGCVIIPAAYLIAVTVIFPRAAHIGRMRAARGLVIIVPAAQFLATAPVRIPSAFCAGGNIGGCAGSLVFQIVTACLIAVTAAPRAC